MKLQSLAFILAGILSGTANNFLRAKSELPKDFKLQESVGISFTENKGQVHDQNNQPRPDVLYGAMAGNMAVHIKTRGISYQLYRVDSYKESEDIKTRQKYREPDQLSIYRIDLNWINHNTNFTRTEGDALPGYSNYYLENCPEGALHVLSYKSITLKNLYDGINLHYYEKNGELKHDYIVAPYTDYRQIQLQVKGAEVSLNTDGSLVLNTPLGKVQEGAPVVYQNGRQLKARWFITNTEHGPSISYEIENYNPGYELIIDPVTRVWGTFYGGTGDEHGSSCATDFNGNVYLSGYTTLNPGSVMATFGSHQAVYGGGNYDAFLVKFNSGGSRQWATFYGGSANDGGGGCATDASGNVYMTGYSESSAGNAIATPGSHQSVYGGGDSDAFLVKFNSSGIRQWATYYGGTNDDGGASCATDASGNIYIAGSTKSSSGIATSGIHQSAFGGGFNDVFLVKFDANGIRQWGTYYGGAGEEYVFSCSIDASDNVYMSGYTFSDADIATAGSHQSTRNGAGDAYLVKFNPGGIRQWGTYYGGSSSEFGYSCTSDISGNVYLVGSTASSNAGAIIATVGSHQPAFGGSNFTYDCFLVKFNANGVRQWGTFYGGFSSDHGYSCITDASGNIYMAGYSNSINSGAIVTFGSYQTAGGGGSYDPFLVKFNSNGNRQWGTYYGGMADDYAYHCTIDVSGNIYMTGVTASNSSTLASSGSHQTSHGGAYYDAFLVKFDVCDIAPDQPSMINGYTSACKGVTAPYNTPVAIGASSYNWALPAGWSGASNTNSIITTPGTSGIFTVIAINACGASPEQTLHVSVNDLPSITASSSHSPLCVGESAILTGSGASNYTFNPGGTGTSITISPTLTLTYIITGIDGNGCSNTGSFTQHVAECTAMKHEELRQINRGLSVFPNPTSGQINLELDADSKITIVNAIGQVVYSSQLSAGHHQINLEPLAKGIYVVKAGNITDLKTIKVIKE